MIIAVAYVIFKVSRDAKALLLAEFLEAATASMDCGLCQEIDRGNHDE